MRLPVERRAAALAVGLSTVLAGCSLIPGGRGETVSAPASGVQLAQGYGPSADYPMVLGDPYFVDGELYTPSDTLNYDVVGYAGVDDGAGITIAHKTLPLPSYVQVTSLDTGKTILARVERRGPMMGARLIALSPAAAAQLGGGEGTPVRARRVNPPEAARAKLRIGRAAPEPIETPKGLLDALRRKLPASGSASLQTVVQAPVAGATAQQPVAKPERHSQPRALPPIAASATAPTEATPVAKPSPPPPASAPRPSTSSGNGFVVQAGTFSVRANAQKVAEAIDGHVSQVGKYFRVRTGPFTSRGQADAALAKVRAAGYSDARVYTAG